MDENIEDKLVDALEEKKKGKLDIVLEKVISRKLLVFVTATVLLSVAGLTSDTWGLIAMVYISGQAAVDVVRTIKHG